MNTEKLNTKVTTEAGIMWKALSDKDKEPYELIYREEKEKYKEALDKWKSNELSRSKKLTGDPEEVQINETTGSTKQEEPLNDNETEKHMFKRLEIIVKFIEENKI